jgi:type IV pilus assembly protein PilC
MTSRATHKHLFYAEMAKLLEAGFDIRKAATVLTNTKIPAAQVAFLKDLQPGLDAGLSITASLAKDPGSISELERNIIDAGERGGKLGPAFQHLADYFGMVASSRESVVRGMLYPLVILHIGIIIAVVPTALMQGTKSVAEILGELLITLLTVYVVGFVLFLGIRAILKMAPENAGVDRLVNRLPWIGKARRNLAMARFCKVYHACLLAGIAMTETVQLSSEATRSGALREAGAGLLSVAKDGQALGPQFISSGAFPAAFARSYATGEEAGTLDKDLAIWANLFQMDAETSVRMASVALPKVFYFLILAFVAWRIVGFFSGYYSQLDRIGD